MILSLVLGAMVGLVMGLTGAGGGILAVPALVFGLHMTVAAAGPIGLLAVGIGAATGALGRLRSGHVRYKAAALMAVTGALCAPFGSWLAQRMNTHLLSLVFALVLLGVGLKSLREGRRTPAASAAPADLPCMRSASNGRFIWNSRCALSLSGMGVIAGVLSGLLGVGGGFVIVPALQRYSNLAMQSVVATSLAVIALISLSGFAGSIFNGHFNATVGLPFVGGAVLGMLIGTVLAARYAAQGLKTAFGVVCLAVAGGLAFRTLA